MILQLISLSLLFGAALGHRALTLEAENYVTALFQSINPGIDYDKTNYLVDLSGTYVICSNLGRRGQLDVSEVQENGEPIYGLIDYGEGSNEDAESVTEYDKATFKSWLSRPEFLDVIRKSDTFGCSNRPSCGGYYVVGCLFNAPGKPVVIPTPPPPAIEPSPKAVAFTPEQYDLTEKITGVSWDRSYFLEDLSGTETDCSMIARPYHDWIKAELLAKERGLRVTGLAGSAVNRGETEPAMVEIISGFSSLIKNPTKELGCSVIPDCIYGGQMYVVVGCLYTN